jgi:hypothetical protein
MRTYAPFAFAIGLLVVCDLPAQGRGRRGQRPDNAQPVAASAPQPATEADKKPKTHLAIVGGDVYLGTGQRMTGASVLLGDDKIEAVGHNLTLPEGTTILDAKGKAVSPGFVCVLGFGMGAPRSGPFADSVNPFDPEIKQALAAGVTTFMAGSAGAGPTLSGSNAIIKLSYGDVKGMVLREDTVVGLSVPLTLADRDKLEDSVKKSREYLKALEEFTKQKAADPNAKEPTVPAGAEKTVAVLRGQAQLWITLGGGGGGGGGRRGGGGGGGRLGRRFDSPGARSREVVRQGCRPAEARQCLADPRRSGSNGLDGRAEPPRSRSTIAARPGSHRQQHRFRSDPGQRRCAGRCHLPRWHVWRSRRWHRRHHGAGPEHAAFRRGIRCPRRARQPQGPTNTDSRCRQDPRDRFPGRSLEPGKDADVLILDGDPLHYSSFVTTAVVNGKVVYEKAKEPLYKHIAR